MTELLAARLQMAFTLGAHIVLACFGVGLPILLLVAEGIALRTGDSGWRTLAKRWSRAFAVLFAVGAVSGTVLSFEMGLLWPAFMARYGSVIGLPFTLEAFAFFLEAIFLGIYLYGWDRLSPRAHWWSGVPVAIAGFASAAFVVCANAWMNAPSGFREDGGRVVDVDPIAAMANAAAFWQAAHLVVATWLVTGFCVAGAYALEILRGRDGRHARRALTLGLAMGAVAAPLQLVAGDGVARMVARTQPLKLAAMERLEETTARAPLHVGGIVPVPGALSWLAYGDADAVVKGLDAFPPDAHPPVA
ncbi:MAG TPA: cytochrome ubiquinol oxidase subunit I, partial [Planctomycetota bacterium]|nr:cytochrome ubiquinol oxidase subunit I [Planctomycetota bacterium]